MLSGQAARQSEGTRTDSEANGAEEAEGGAALEADDLDALVGQAVKVADPDQCAKVGALAHERDPEKYPYTHLTGLTDASWTAGNPLYDILHDGRTVFDGPPLLSMGTWRARYILDGSAVEEWRVDLPSLTSAYYPGTYVLSSGRLRVFDGELPNLMNGHDMFYGCSVLTTFSSALPCLTDGSWMFHACKLDLPSVQTIARTIKDNSSMASRPSLFLGITKALRGQVEDELALMRSKGWGLNVGYN